VNLKVLNDGMILVFEGNIVDALDTAAAETKIKSIFSKLSVQPITSTYPDMKAILIPEVGVQIIAYEDKLMLEQQTASENVELTDQHFLQLATELPQVVSLAPVSYGFKYSFLVNATNEGELRGYVSSVQTKSGLDHIPLPENAKLSSALPSVMFDIDDGICSIEFHFNSEKLQMSVGARILYTTSVPDYEKVSKIYSQGKKMLATYIESFEP
jgi:hypothetical protein